MNTDEKKPKAPAPAVDDGWGPASDDDWHPADEENAERTVATPFDMSFALDSNVPLPVSSPPPPLGAEEETKLERPSPLASTGFGGPPPPALHGDALVPRINPEDSTEDEETRAAPREAFTNRAPGAGPGAHVVVESDAVGDDATLAVPPSRNDAIRGIGAALAETLGVNQLDEEVGRARASSQQRLPAMPAMPGMAGEGVGFPPPAAPFGAPSANVNAPPQAQVAAGRTAPAAFQPAPWGGGAFAQGAAPAPPSMQLGGPMSSPMNVPMSAPMGAPMQPMQPMGANMTPPPHGGAPNMPNPNMPNMGGPNWQPAPAPGLGRPPSAMNPQLIALVAIGTVCLAIFVIGLYLFFTTRF